MGEADDFHVIQSLITGAYKHLEADGVLWIVAQVCSLEADGVLWIGAQVCRVCFVAQV
jgi:16S rRNA G1207 methylase RsmC